MPINGCDLHAIGSLANPNVSFNEGHAWAFVLDFSHFGNIVNTVLYVSACGVSVGICQ